MAEKKGECVQVVVRCRPLFGAEVTQNCKEIVDTDPKVNTISIRNPTNENETKGFTFDATYDKNTVQKNFYDESCAGIIESCLEGFNGTIFAYGQTGCGKSFTMQGKEDPPELRGVIPNAIAHIFEYVNAMNDESNEYLVHCSYLEIYMEDLTDLLASPKNPPKLDIKEDPTKGIYVKNLSTHVVKNEKETNDRLESGLKNRHVAATLMNSESSRSHSIFTISIEMSSKDNETGKDHIKVGKLNLVDLAGSERQKKTGATGAQMKEGTKINLSLSALGNVISALADAGKGKGHIPYRDSKLTRLLQDSLGGNTKTLMIAAVSPADKNYDETLSTLRYANRAKNITNKPKINEDPKDTMLREHKDEIARLKEMLEAFQSGAQPLPPGLGSPQLSGESSAEGQASTDVAAIASDTSELRIEMDAKLKEKDAEVQRERANMQEMMAKLAQLQGDIAGSNNNQTGAELTQEEIEAAEKKKADAKARAQRRREKREKLKAKLLKIKQEKQALEDQLNQGGGGTLEDYMTNMTVATPAEGTKDGAATTTEGQDAAINFAKIEKKLKKKIRSLLTEIEDIKDDSRVEKNQLLETISEQSKDMKLYEQILHAVMNDKEFKNATERAQWSEEDDEWLLPVIKQRDFKVGKVDNKAYRNMGNNSNIGGGGSTGGYGNNNLPSLPSSSGSATITSMASDMLPDINGGGLKGNNRTLPAMADMADMSSVASFSNNDGGIIPISRSAGGYQNYDMDDRVEYQPSMAKVTDFSSFATMEGIASPATPDKEKKRNKSGRPAKVKKDKQQMVADTAAKNTTEQEYANDNDFENEYTDDYAGPVQDWGFLVPQGQDNVPIPMDGKENKKQRKEKKKKNKLPVVNVNTYDDDGESRTTLPSLTSLPPI